MRKEIGSGKERTVGWLIYGGLSLSIFCAVCFILFFVMGIFPAMAPEVPGIGKLGGAASLAVSIIGIVLGLIFMFTGVGYGIYATRTENSGPRRTEPNFRVLSRFCLDKTHQLLVSDFDIEIADRPKFYVRGALANGLVGEFETTVDVFYQAGEGMTGEAQIQGKWLGQFLPYIGEAVNET